MYLLIRLIIVIDFLNHLSVIHSVPFTRHEDVEKYTLSYVNMTLYALLFVYNHNLKIYNMLYFTLNLHYLNFLIKPQV